ncbi:MAG TPA: ADP-ribosylglycohydrolase family protein [Symbiobacteriaceae bacterium]|nr:ADP-ribosylglycohydrolase family protein [Symbiobacteriaceae bacterium]
MDWERLILQVLHESRPAYDEPPDWRSVLTLYKGLTPDEVGDLDRIIQRMITDDYRNPFSARENLPFDDTMVNLPAGMVPDDLLSIEAAALVATERGLGGALFALNRLMRSPRWHALSPRLFWLNQEGFAAQKKLMATEAGRYLGALLGLACGDALGVTLEFLTRAEVRRNHPDGHREITGGGPFRFSPGECSDDTAMAMAVARGIIEAPDRPVEAVGRHFQAWYGSNPPDVGSTCRLALETHRKTGSWAATSTEVARQLGPRTAGNGALMRTLPAALAYGADTAQAIQIARMTHPHPDSDAAVTAYHTMVNSLVGGAAKAQAHAAAVQVAGHLADRIHGISAAAETDIQATGYVVDTLQAAMWAFMTTETLEDCIVRAVNLGDDADTAGAVAGGLAGAYYGAGAVPRRWSMALKIRTELEEAAEQLFVLSRPHKQ